MAYRRPAIEVIQEFQEAAAALALPTLPAVVVGPGFQIKDDVDAGTYDSADLSVSSFAYDGLVSGGVVDLTDAPEDTAEAVVHKGVGVTLQNAYLVKLPALPAASRTTGTMATPNLFQDSETNAFSSINPGGSGEPVYYLEILAGGSGDNVDQRFRIEGKTTGVENELELRGNWEGEMLPVASVEYRIVEYREEEVIPEADFAAKGIAKTATAVTIQPGLTTSTDDLPVDEAVVLLSWRALRPDLAGAVNAFTNLDSLEAEFGVGAITPPNIGPYAVSLALQNTTTEVALTGLGSDYFTNEEQSYQSALEYLETRDVYAIALMTQTTAIHQTGKSHVEGMSASSVGRERLIFVNRPIVTSEVLMPASGIGTQTSEGTDNGLAGTLNKTFQDPDNGAFITNSVNTGHYLEVTSYTAVEGIDRSVDPNEADHLNSADGNIRIGGAAFTDTDLGKFIIVQGATTAGNDVAYAISAQTGVQADVTPSPATGEVMPAACKTWVAEATPTTIALDSADAVVQTTKTWTFDNAAFIEDDVGRLMIIAGTVSNDGVYVIESVSADGKSVVTEEDPAGDETFPGAGDTAKIYTVNRAIARDLLSDSVNGTSRVWTIINANFTDSDVGRKLNIVGSLTAQNDGEHIIETVIDATTVRTDASTVPVTETFDGIATELTTLDVRATTPDTTQAAYITETRHEITAVTSDTSLTLASDPTAGFGGTLEDVVYRITKDLTLNEQATTIAGYSTSLGSRRVIHTWPDKVAISVNAVSTLVPGYFVGAALAGMCAGLPSQAGFTNLTLTGFVGRENSDDIFSDTQLDTIAGGGTLILTQPVVDSALSVRHQLTTDVSTIYFQELSVTKNVDLLARFFRGLFAPFLGIYNITDPLMDILKTRGEGGIEYLKAQRAPRVGAPLRSGQLSRIEESTTVPDSIEIDVSVNIPLPLNNITLTLLV